MDAVHVDQACLPSKSVLIPSEAFFQSIEVPAGMSGLATEDQADGRIEQFQCLGPLIRFSGILFLGRLSDLPRAPDLVTQSPVFDVVRLLAAVLSSQVGVVCVLARIAVLEPGER